MASTDWRIAGTGFSVDIGGTDWTNPTRIAFNDGSGAAMSNTAPAFCDYLISGRHDPGINTTATVVGLEVQVDVLTNAFTTTNIFLVADTAFSKYTDAKPISGTGLKTAGGPSDLWLGAGSSVGYVGFTAVEVSAATFGLAIAPQAVAGTQAMTVDYVAIKYYISDGSVVSTVPVLGGSSC